MNNADHRRRWIIDLTLGGTLGALVGAIVAVNIVIFGGIERGYEAGIGEVFDERPIVGVVAVLAFLICTTGGVAFVRARRLARRHK